MPTARALVITLLVFFTLATIPAPTDAAQDWDIPGGHFYTQTGGDTGRGYAVVDDVDAPFWSEFSRLGGVQAVGYPASGRFMWNGFVCQVFQRVVFQWRPEVGQVYFVNVFDLFHEAGQDVYLLHQRQVPPPKDWAEQGKPWSQIVRDRLAVMDAYPAITHAYQAVVGDPVQMNGLPTSDVVDMGNHYALRAQRVSFQLWKENVPWATAGQVTVSLGGDLAKEVGILPDPAALVPTDPPGATPAPTPGWSLGASMPTPRAFFGIAEAGGKIYVVGGSTTGGLDSALATLEAYDPGTNTWSTLAPMPTARAGLAAAAVGGKIYAIGGAVDPAAPGPGTPHSPGYLATVEMYDPATNTWTQRAPMPTDRALLAAVAVDGKIYAIGGTFGGYHSYLGIVEEYDPATDTWMTRASLPRGRESLAATALGDDILVAGGFSLSGGGADRYDPATDTWSSLAPLITWRQGLGLATVAGRAYALGGLVRAAPVVFPDAVEVYEPAANAWTVATHLPTPRSGLGVIALNGRIYAIGGSGNGSLGTVEIYQP